MTMHPRTKEVLDYLDTCRAKLEKAVAELPGALHGERPGEDRWSVSEILEHLSLVEGRIDQLLMKELDAARAAGLAAERETSPVLPTLDLARVTNRSEPITAREGSLPTGTVSTDASLMLLRKLRRALRDAILAADGLALGTIRIPHPRLGTLDLYQWLAFVGGHEARHTAQIREVAAAVGAQAGD
jgi:uncharacterized damage-inducible protein DinB